LPNLLRHGPGAVLYAVVDQVVDNYGLVLDALDHDVNQGRATRWVKMTDLVAAPTLLHRFGRTGARNATTAWVKLRREVSLVGMGGVALAQRRALS
jgi:hypothetical protein